MLHPQGAVVYVVGGKRQNSMLGKSVQEAYGGQLGLCLWRRNGVMEETPEHLLFFCDKASQFLNSIGVHLPQTGISTRDIHSFLKISAVPTLQHNMFVTHCCRQLWKCRNAFIFRNETMTLRQLLLSCAAEAKSWKARMSRRQKPIAKKWCKLFEDTAQSIM